MNDEVQPLTLSALIETLGRPLIWPLTGATGLEQSVSVPVIYDRLEQSTLGTTGGILLVVGVSPSTEEALHAIEIAKTHGFCAIAVKVRDAPYGDLVRLANENQIAVLAVDPDVPWHHLGNLMTAVTNTQTGSVSVGDGNLFALANAVATSMDGAVAIEDIDQNILAHSNLEHHRIDSLRRSGIFARHVPNLTKHDDQYRQVVENKGVIYFPFDPSDDELPRAAVAIRSGREVLGSIWVIENVKPATLEAESILLEAARLASIEVLRARSAVDLERQVRSEWLKSLLDGHGAVPVTAARFGLTQDMPAVMLGFMFQTGPSPSKKPLIRQLVSAVEQYCSIYESNVSCVSIGQIVYLLFPSVQDMATTRRLAQDATATIESSLESPICTAVSSTKLGTNVVPDLRCEVDEVLSIISSNNRVSVIASTKDVHAQRLMIKLERIFKDNHLLILPGIRALLDHDRQKRSAYRSSLCAYFSAMGDISAAANELNVHPNTLRYRLRRAQLLFDLHLDEPDEQLIVWLQLRMAGQH